MRESPEITAGYSTEIQHCCVTVNWNYRRPYILRPGIGVIHINNLHITLEDQTHRLERHIYAFLYSGSFAKNREDGGTSFVVTAQSRVPLRGALQAWQIIIDE